MQRNPYYGLHGLQPRAAAPARPEAAEPRPAVSDERELHELDGDARLLEWTAGPVGRQGRKLHAEIERYLAFFEIARAEA